MKLKTLAYFSLIMLAVSLVLSAHAQTFRVIHAFTGGTEGDHPRGGVVIHGGDLFGTAYVDGLLHWGFVYQAKRSAGDNWSVITLSYFPISGGYPWSRPLFGPDGQLYGTTIGGGSAGDGLVYSLTPASSASSVICKTAFCPWQETELHSFSGTDGRQPAYGDLAWDKQGNIYGTTLRGGPLDEGTVFEIMPSGNGWIAVSIYSFSDPSGAYPNAGVVIDRDGNLFGTTSKGDRGYGTVFELKYVAGVGWQETVLYRFANGNDGAYPIGGLIFDNSGNLYGSTASGGSGGGTVFELSPSGDTWTYNLLYSLPGVGGAGGPWAPLSFDTAGNLYGTTGGNGSHNAGTVFKLTKTGNGWAYTELHSFDPDLDGGYPEGSGVAIDADGTLYGTTSLAGPRHAGTLWMIKP